MKRVVIVMQEENWEDDGGDHDPDLIKVSDKDFDRLVELHNKGTINGDEHDEVRAIISTGQTQWEFPCEIHRIFNFWHRYGD